jgi:hypothetical protein
VLVSMHLWNSFSSRYPNLVNELKAARNARSGGITPLSIGSHGSKFFPHGIPNEIVETHILGALMHRSTFYDMLNLSQVDREWRAMVTDTYKEFDGNNL